jgi:hypothetical protein
VLVVAAIAGWYFHQQRLVSAERRRLDGKWMVLNRDGQVLRLPDGTPAISEFDASNYSIDPLQEPKHLDFHTSNGTSHAIYRWEEEELVVMQVSSGVQRPTSFDQEPKDIRLKPGGLPGVRESSVSTYRLVRAED